MGKLVLGRKEGILQEGRVPLGIKGPFLAEQRRREAHTGADLLHEFFSLGSKGSASQG